MRAQLFIIMRVTVLEATLCTSIFMRLTMQRHKVPNIFLLGKTKEQQSTRFIIHTQPTKLRSDYTCIVINIAIIYSTRWAQNRAEMSTIRK